MGCPSRLRNLPSGRDPSAVGPKAWPGHRNVREDADAHRAAGCRGRQLPSDVQRSNSPVWCFRNAWRTLKSTARDSGSRRQGTSPPVRRTAGGTRTDARTLYRDIRKWAYYWGSQIPRRGRFWPPNLVWSRPLPQSTLATVESSTVISDHMAIWDVLKSGCGCGR